MADVRVPDVFIPQFKNPLELAQQSADLQGSLYRNQLFKSKQAAGQAFQGSIGPDGTPNQNKLLQGLALAGPSAAMSAQESAQAGQNLASSSLAFNDAQKAILGRNIGAVLALPADQQNRQTYEGMINFLHQSAGLDDSHVASALQRLPPDGSPPQAFQQFAQTLLIGSLAGPDVANQAFPSGGVAQTGAGTVSYTRQPNLRGGALSVAPGNIANEDMQPQYIVDPNSPPGAPRYLQVNTPRNVAAPSQYAAPNMGSGAYPARPGVGGGGAAPGAVPAGAAAPVAVPTAPAGSTLAAPPQNLPEANAADQAKFVTDQSALPAVRQNMVNLGHANDALKLLSATGPGTEGAHQLYSFLNAQGVLPKDMADNSTNYDLFRKYAEKYVIDSSGGQNTDAGRAMTAASNAGTGIGTAANQEVLRNEIARQRNAVVQLLSSPDQRTGSGYLSHSADFGGRVDQRGLVTDLYTPAQNAAYRKTLKGAALDRYLRAMGMAAAFKLNTPQGVQ